MTEPTVANKAQSLDAQLAAINLAWNVAQGLADGQPSGWGSIVETFAAEGYVVMADNGKYWRVSFSEVNGEIEFADKEKWSELRIRWVRKSGVLVLMLGEDEDALEQTMRALDDGAVEPAPEAIRGAPEGDPAEHMNAEEGEQEASPMKGVPAQDGETVVEEQDVVIDGGDCGHRGRPIRSLGENRVGEYLVLWGSPEERDSYRTYFTPETEEFDVVFRAVGRVPMFYHHAMHDEVRTSVIGLVDVMLPDSIGLWVEGELNKASKYREDIRFMLSQKSLWWSSGTLPGAVLETEIADDGWIPRWPIVDASMTPRPAEYRMVDRPIEELRSLYKAAGLELPLLPKSDTPADAGVRQRELDIEIELLELLDL